MNVFDPLTMVRGLTGRDQSSIRLQPPAETGQINILWLYPDMLNLHGGRGDLMALLHVGSLIGLTVEVQRVDDASLPLPLEWADILLLNSGELNCAPKVISCLAAQGQSLADYCSRQGMIIAFGSSGAILARQTHLNNGSSFTGLGLLDMQFHERHSVYGNDLWFTMESGLEVIGNQIQVADVELASNQQPLGRVIYGRGNCGAEDEGARTNNLLFSNGLGPLLVKNPRLAAEWLAAAAAAKGLPQPPALEDQQIVMEDQSFALIKQFIEAKISRESS